MKYQGIGAVWVKWIGGVTQSIVGKRYTLKVILRRNSILQNKKIQKKLPEINFINGSMAFLAIRIDKKLQNSQILLSQNFTPLR